MALQDDILLDIKNNKIPVVFSCRQLCHTQHLDGSFLVGENSYKLSTLRSHTANYCEWASGEPKGFNVKNGADALFIFESKGRYRLKIHRDLPFEAELNDSDNVYQDEEAVLIELPARKALNAESLLGFIADYLAFVPYQRYFKRERNYFPVEPVVGIEQRLQSYFWPRISDTWHKNTELLNQFEQRFKALKPDLTYAGSASALRRLVWDICDWGGVKRPQLSEAELQQQVVSVCDSIIKRKSVHRSNIINSAYTKLYAIAMPDDFVIYDSRVATALTSILDKQMPVFIHSPDWSDYSALGFVDGRGGSRPREYEWRWPNGYRSWKAQLAANRLCCDLRDYINQNKQRYSLSKDITLRELEAILFMEGY
jgi:hypothetical protein